MEELTIMITEMDLSIEKTQKKVEAQELSIDLPVEE